MAKKSVTPASSTSTAAAPADQPAIAQPQQAPSTQSDQKTASDQMQQRITKAREEFTKVHTQHNQAAIAKWNTWSTSVRNEFVRRAQAAVIAGVQASVGRKQAQQWGVTIKFVLDDVFDCARKAASFGWDDKDGIGVLVTMFLKGEENLKDPEGFDKRVDAMLAEMKDGQVPGFKMQDKKVHTNTLRDMRTVYGVEWAAYVITKLAAQ
jgi:hypothetical protein